MSDNSKKLPLETDKQKVLSDAQKHKSQEKIGGKFKSVADLLKAYNALECEFTRRCEFIKKLVSQNETLTAKLAERELNTVAPNNAASAVVAADNDTLDNSAVVIVPQKICNAITENNATASAVVAADNDTLDNSAVVIVPQKICNAITENNAVNDDFKNDKPRESAENLQGNLNVLQCSQAESNALISAEKSQKVVLPPRESAENLQGNLNVLQCSQAESNALISTEKSQKAVLPPRESAENLAENATDNLQVNALSANEKTLSQTQIQNQICAESPLGTSYQVAQSAVDKIPVQDIKSILRDNNAFKAVVSDSNVRRAVIISYLKALRSSVPVMPSRGSGYAITPPDKPTSLEEAKIIADAYFNGRN